MYSLQLPVRTTSVPPAGTAYTAPKHFSTTSW